MKVVDPPKQNVISVKVKKKFTLVDYVVEIPVPDIIEKISARVFLASVT
jgi:hypothetical protein